MMMMKRKRVDCTQRGNESKGNKRHENGKYKRNRQDSGREPVQEQLKEQKETRPSCQRNRNKIANQGKRSKKESVTKG